MHLSNYRGVFPVVPTNFDAASALDFMIDAGSQGLCILATLRDHLGLPRPKGRSHSS